MERRDILQTAEDILKQRGQETSMWKDRFETTVVDPDTNAAVQLIISDDMLGNVRATTRDDNMYVDLATNTMYSKGLSRRPKKQLRVDDARYNRLAGFIMQVGQSLKF